MGHRTETDDSAADDRPKPFLEHFVDLRRTLVHSALAVGLGILIAIPAAPWILRALKAPVAAAGRDPDDFLRILRIGGSLTLALQISFWSGLLLSAPFVVLFVARFIFPGLTRREKMAIRRAAVFAVLLFALGAGMCYTVTLPVALQMMFAIGAWLGDPLQFVELSDYVGFVLKLMLAFGLAFELPVALVALGSVGLVNSRTLREKRRHVVVGLLVAGMLLTPPDPFTQLLMAVPLWILYEICIVIIAGMERRQ